MSKKAHETALPKLRFPEFREKEAWEILPLGELMNGVTARNRDKKISRVFTNSAVSGIIDQRDFFDKDIATAGNTDNYSIIELGDYVYNPRISESAPVGPTFRNKLGQGIVSPLYTVFRFHNSNHNEFYDYYFGSTHWQHSLKAIGNSGARHDRMGISLTQLRIVNVPYPSLSEQQKVAATLSSLDALLTAQTAKLTALQAHKRGLMHDLFPAEGETVPKRRFSEFQEAGEWVSHNFHNLLNDILDFRGRTPQKLGMTWGGGNIISLSANNVKNGYIDYNAECYLGSEELYTKWMGKVNLEKGDIIFTMEAPLGKALLIPNSQKYILSQRVVAFKTKNLVNNSFFIQLIWSEYFQKEIEKLSTGSTAKGINQKALKTILVKLPSQIREQQKIADCLSSLDNLITAQTQKIDALKLHKKGLMQALFPTSSAPKA